MAARPHYVIQQFFLLPSIITHLDNPFNYRSNFLPLDIYIKSRKTFHFECQKILVEDPRFKIERLDSIGTRILLFFAEKKCYSQSCAIIAIYLETGNVGRHINPRIVDASIHERGSATLSSRRDRPVSKTEEDIANVLINYLSSFDLQEIVR